MRKYSLKFENKLLENQYQLYSDQQQILHIITFTKINYLIVGILGLMTMINGWYITSGICISCFIMTYGFQIAITKLNQITIIRMYEFLLLANPIVGFLGFYFPESNHFGINIVVLLMVEAHTLVITPLIFLAGVIQFVNSFMFCFIIIYNAFGFSLYIIVWLSIFFFCVYNYHSQKRNQRLLFQGSQVNQSIYNLIKDTTQEDVIYFKLNQELLKYEFKFTYIAEFSLTKFLSSVYITPNENIKQYLFSKIALNNVESAKYRTFAYWNNRQRLALDIYIQYYPYLRFYIKIKKEQDNINTFSVRESQLLYHFYKQIILQCQKNQQRINFHHIFKQICYFNSNIQMERIFKNPYLFLQSIQGFDVLKLLKQELDQLKIDFDVEYDFFQKSYHCIISRGFLNNDIISSQTDQKQKQSDKYNYTS